MRSVQYFQAPYALLKIECRNSAVTQVSFIDRQDEPADLTPFTKKILAELAAYHADSTHAFDLPLAPHGTDYQKRVWGALSKIATGDVVPYGVLSAQLQSSPRAVGNACRRNPIPIIVPCHRVVSASGIGGFSGATDGDMLNIKKWLLHHEGVSTHGR